MTKHSVLSRFVLAMLVCAGLQLSASAQLVQQGNKIVGTGVAGTWTGSWMRGANQGMSVAISADGNTAIVGGPLDSMQGGSGSGAAWVYTRTNGVWTQQGNKLVGTGAAGPATQGSSVALSADGNTAIVGGPNDSNYVGAAWVFTRSGGVWTQQGNKLVGTDGVGTCVQGVSVSLSADGNTALVGGPSDGRVAINSEPKGATWVFTRSGGVWTQEGPKLVGTGASGASIQGHSVSLSADGNTAFVGGPGDSLFDPNGQPEGACWVFTRSGGVWSQQGDKLIGSGGVDYALQGWSVSLSGDGNTAVVGELRDAGIWVFTRSGGLWTQQGNKLVATDATAHAGPGISVSISSDGNTVISGGPNDSGSVGAAWMFTKSGGAWSQSGNKLVGTDAVDGPAFGQSVSISGDGKTAIVGGPNGVDADGAAWFFSEGIAITATAGPNGSISPSGSVLVAPYGAQAFTLSPDFAYQVDSLIVDGAAVDSTTSYTFYPDTAVHSIRAVFGLSPNARFLTVNVKAGWNIISVPKEIRTGDIFPSAITSAFAYQGSNVPKDTLVPGVGYWLKLDSARASELLFLATSQETIQVTKGWNLIGSFYTPIAVSSIESPDSGMTISMPYEFGVSSYVLTDNLQPGSGYWLKCNEAGELIFAAPSGRVVARNHPRVIQTSDMPPPPPTEQGVVRHQVPKQFALDQNYPNPFNPVTTIRYELSKASFVHLSIYNILGQEVRTLVNGTQQAGYKSVSFDGSNLASGMYFYRINAGGFTDVKKLILLK